jgi:hypothetical protein
MIIDVRWANSDRTIIQWDFLESWSWSDFYIAAGKSVAMRKEPSHQKPIAIILNMSENPPRRGGALTHSHNAFQINPNGRDVIVVVGSNAFTLRIVALFREMYNEIAQNIFAVENLGEAHQLIEDVRRD